MSLPVNEIFYTIQCEASYTGAPAVFLRLQGCNVGCPWCDTKHTWEIDETLSDEPAAIIAKENDSPLWAWMPETEIVEAVKNAGINGCHVVITGGEPAEHDITKLVTLLIEAGHTVQLETSGTAKLNPYLFTKKPFYDDFWVTLSPKVDMPNGKKILPEILTNAHEIKYPVGKIADAEYLEKLVDTCNLDPVGGIWLQPLSKNPKATRICIDTAKKNGWNLSMQGHKFLNIR